MSFSIPFFKKKSESQTSLSSKCVPETSPTERATQANGDLTRPPKFDDGVASKKSVSSKLTKTKSQGIYIDYAEYEKSDGTKMEEESCMKSKSPKMSSAARSSRLSKTLDRVLRDKDALPYFIQFMDSRAAGNLVKFWLDADVFQTTAISRMNHHDSPAYDETGDRETSSSVVAVEIGTPLSSTVSDADEDGLPSCVSSPQPSLPSDFLPQKSSGCPGSVTAHGEFPDRSPSNSPTSVPKIACESASLAAVLNREPVAAGAVGNGELATAVVSREPATVVGNREPAAVVANREPAAVIGNRGPATIVGSRELVATAAGAVENGELPAVVVSREPAAIIANREPVVENIFSDSVVRGEDSSRRANVLELSNVASSSSSLSRLVADSDADEQTEDVTEAVGSDLNSPSIQSEERHPKEERSCQENIRKSIERDAVVIFSKYLSPDCSQPIKITHELRTKTIGRICNEDGSINPLCFVDCQQYVFDVMDIDYYPEFLQSIYHIRHQIDILTQLQLVDFLYNDTSLSYLTEFMEEDKAVSVLQCFLDLDNFQHHLSSQGDDYDGVEAQNDAMIIYDKYISMQATHTVRFDDKIRLEVESSICHEEGPLPDCFALPWRLVLQRMEQAYFPRFLRSEIYSKYVTDLLNTSHVKQEMDFRRKRAGSDASSEKSVGSQNAAGSESARSKNTYLARDTSGRQFAKAMNKFTDMRIDSSLFNPDYLWHRPNAGRMKFGKVTELGQFVSDFDPDPDHDKKKNAPFFSTAKRKEKEKTEEENAWSIAQKIVKDVISDVNGDFSFSFDLGSSSSSSNASNS